MYRLRRYILWIVPALLCAACSGSVGTNPAPAAAGSFAGTTVYCRARDARRHRRR